jgi:nicotinamide-nucleotide amidase
MVSGIFWHCPSSAASVFAMSQHPPSPLHVTPTTWATSHRLAAALRERGWQLRTAESCTGGLIAATCTALSGSSDWFDRSYVTYSNAAKTGDLGVPPGLIDAHGAVSVEVAQAMVMGLVRDTPGVVGVAVTGVAGPTGGSVDKPVGWVCTAWSVGGRVWTDAHQWPGDRAAVRAATVEHALATLVEACESGP